MDAHHRKIDLQSPSDLTYLLNNIRVAAQEKIDLDIPPSAAPEGQDAFRSQVQKLVEEYIHQTLTLALPNLTLNGLDPTPTVLEPNSIPKSANSQADDDSNYEPYDPRLAEKLRTLYAEFEVQSTRVAELRREAPGAAARSYMERLEEELRVEREAERKRGLEGEQMNVDPLDVGPLERKGDVERMWGKGTRGLAELGEVTGVVAKLERAGKAMEVVEGM